MSRWRRVRFMATRTIAQVRPLPCGTLDGGEGPLLRSVVFHGTREPERAAEGLDIADRDGLRRPRGGEGDEERTKYERAPEGALGEDPHCRLPRLLDDLLGFGVEEVDAVGYEAQPDLLVRLRLHRGVDPRHDLLIGSLGVEEDLRAQRLDDFHHRVEGEIGRVRAV